MAQPPQVSNDSLPVSALLAMDKICRQLEAELESGKKPQVEAYLGDTPEPQRSQLRRDLETIQREHGQKSGHHATLAQFVQNLVASGLMTEDQVQRVLDEQSPNQRPQTSSTAGDCGGQSGHVSCGQCFAAGTPDGPPESPSAEPQPRFSVGAGITREAKTKEKEAVMRAAEKAPSASNVENDQGLNRPPPSSGGHGSRSSGVSY